MGKSINAAPPSLPYQEETDMNTNKQNKQSSTQEKQNKQENKNCR